MSEYAAFDRRVNQSEISFPKACADSSDSVRRVCGRLRWSNVCGGSAFEDGIEGQRISIRYALFNPCLSTL